MTLLSAAITLILTISFFRYFRIPLAGKINGKKSVAVSWVFCPPWWDEHTAICRGRTIFFRVKEES